MICRPYERFKHRSCWISPTDFEATQALKPFPSFPSSMKTDNIVQTFKPFLAAVNRYTVHQSNDNGPIGHLLLMCFVLLAIHTVLHTLIWTLHMYNIVIQLYSYIYIAIIGIHVVSTCFNTFIHIEVGYINSVTQTYHYSGWWFQPL